MKSRSLIVITMVLVGLLLVLSAPALAGPPEEVEGYFNYVPTGCAYERWAGDNYIGRECDDTGEYGYVPGVPGTAGDFIGDSTEVYEITLHDANPENPFGDFTMGWYKGIVEFEGTVLGSDEGTMWIQYIGKSPGNIFLWSGTWQILDGRNGLKGIHGGGTWESCPPGGDFGVCIEGKVHFEP